MNRFAFVALSAIFLITQAEMTLLIIEAENDDTAPNQMCLTETEFQKLGFIKDLAEQAEYKNATDDEINFCEPMNLSNDVVKVLRIPYEKMSKVTTDLESVDKALYFLKEILADTYVSKQVNVAGVEMPTMELPQPLNTNFNDMELHKKMEYERDYQDEKARITLATNKDRHIEDKETTITESMKAWVQSNKNSDNYKSSLTDDIKNFFTYKIDPAYKDNTIVEEYEKKCEENKEPYCMVAGKYGSANLESRLDCYLNEGADGLELNEMSVNNPRELLKLIDVANRMIFEDLLHLASAKFASDIRRNDLYRLRAMYGMQPNGSYTENTYTISSDGEDVEIKGFENLKTENTWFKVDAGTEEFHHKLTDTKKECTYGVEQSYQAVGGQAYTYEPYPTNAIHKIDTEGKKTLFNQMIGDDDYGKIIDEY